MLLGKFFDVWLVGRQTTAGRILMRNFLLSQLLAKKTRHVYFDLTWRWNVSSFDQSSVPGKLIQANSSLIFFFVFFFFELWGSLIFGYLIGKRFSGQDLLIFFHCSLLNIIFSPQFTKLIMDMALISFNALLLNSLPLICLQTLICLIQKSGKASRRNIIDKIMCSKVSSIVASSATIKLKMS